MPDTASAAGLLTNIGAGPYAVTKHAAVALAEYLAITHGDDGIKVSCLCPQGVRTKMLFPDGDDGDDIGANTVRSQGVIEPEDVAATVVEALADERFLVLPHPEVLDYCNSFPSEDTLEACSNGIDDDNNGFTDCEDFSCSMSTDPEILDYCDSFPSEDTLDTWSNGVDDDENGFADCADFSCSQSEDPAIQEYCEDQLEATYERCTDCIDNDGNGFVDCGDFSCADVQAADGSYACRESGTRDLTAAEYECEDSACASTLQQLVLTNATLFCTDGEDNDRDGFVDCDDFDCAMDPVANPTLNIGGLCEAMFPPVLDGAATLPTRCVTAGAQSWSDCAQLCAEGAFDVCGARMCGL